MWTETTLTLNIRGMGVSMMGGNNPNDLDPRDRETIARLDADLRKCEEILERAKGESNPDRLREFFVQVRTTLPYIERRITNNKRGMDRRPQAFVQILARYDAVKDAVVNDKNVVTQKREIVNQTVIEKLSGSREKLFRDLPESALHGFKDAVRKFEDEVNGVGEKKEVEEEDADDKYAQLRAALAGVGAVTAVPGVEECENGVKPWNVGVVGSCCSFGVRDFNLMFFWCGDRPVISHSVC